MPRTNPTARPRASAQGLSIPAAASLLGLGFALLALGIACAVLENGLWAYCLVPGTALVLLLLGYIHLGSPDPY